MARKHVTDRMVCEAYAEYKRIGRGVGVFPYDILMARTGEPFKVCWRAMERACDRDLIEFGVSLRTGWVTAAGEALLASQPEPPSGYRRQVELPPT